MDPFVRSLAFTLLFASTVAHAQLEDIRAMVSTLAEAEKQLPRLATAGRPAQTVCRELLLPSSRPSPEEHARWAAEGFTQPALLDVDMRGYTELTRNATHELDINAVVYRGSGWDAEAVRRALPIVSEVYAQCGVRIATAKFVLANPAYRALDFNPQNEEFVTKAVPSGVTKPILFFGRNHVSNEAHATSSAYAYGPSGCRGSATCNTAWFTNRAINSSYRVLRNDPIALAIAHELGHILADADHTTGPTTNLVHGDGSKIDATLTPEQCAAVRSHRSVRPVR